MVRTKISKKQKKSSSSTSKVKKKTQYLPKKMEVAKKDKILLKKDSNLIEYSPTQELLDEEFIALAIWDCLKNDDPEGVVEIIQAHLEVVNKCKVTKEVNLPRSSLYNALRGKNPTIKTLAKLVNCCV